MREINERFTLLDKITCFGCFYYGKGAGIIPRSAILQNSRYIESIFTQTDLQISKIFPAFSTTACVPMLYVLVSPVPAVGNTDTLNFETNT